MTPVRLGVPGIRVPLRRGQSVAERAHRGKDAFVVPGSSANVEIIRRALAADPDSLADDVVWHFLSPIPELVAHFEGKETVMNDWPRLLDELTGGTFTKHVLDVWPLGDDIVVAHVAVEMTMDGVHHEGSSAVVYRLADGVVVEGFDIPSATI